MHWKKLSPSRFGFFNAENKVGEMSIDYGSSDRVATCVWNDHEYTIRRTGTWKSGVEVVDASTKEILLKAQPKKWYSNHLEVSAQGANFELVIHNNPLAEWCLEQDGELVLAYGLASEGGNVHLRIRSAEKELHPLLHFFLWYLFSPVAQENLGDSLPFALLLNP